MKFNSAEELYDYINDGTDIYDRDEGLYIFSYNAAGSIAYYYLDEDELMELAEEARENDDYIGSLLGPGGYIVDTDNYSETEDIEGDEDVTEILEFLEPLINDDIISAMPNDLLGKKPNPYKRGTVGDYLYTHDELGWVEIYKSGNASSSWSCPPSSILHPFSRNDTTLLDTKIIKVEPGDIGWEKYSIKIYI